MLDENLIAETARYAAGEVHDVTNAISAYTADWKLFTDESDFCKRRREKYQKWIERDEKILRAFVAHRRQGNLRRLRDIKKEIIANLDKK